MIRRCKQLARRLRGTPARVRARWGLIQLAGSASRRSVVATVACLGLGALLPAAVAVATGRFVSAMVRAVRVADRDVGPLIGPLSLLVGLLILEQLVSLLGVPLRRRLGSVVEGVIRHRLRTVLAAPAGIDHLEDQEVRNQAQRVTRGIGARTVGQGVDGQFAAFFGILGGLLALGSVAVVAPGIALYMALLLFVLRARNAFQSGGFVNVQAGRIDDVREARYWLDAAGGPLPAKELRLFGLQEWVIDRQFEAAARARKPVWDGVDEFIRRQRIPLLLVALGYSAPLLWIADRAASGHMTPGTVAFVCAALLGASGMAYAGDLWSVDAALYSTEALRSLEARAAAVVAPSPTSSVGPADRVAPAIRFEGVSFSYPEGSPVLDRLDLELRAGESLAIVGANGAGKTTLVKVLARLYEPTGGRITADGIDIAALDVRAWRRRLSAVFQDFVRYEAPARDNVGISELGRVRPDLLAEAVEAAAATDVIAKLPLGWDTILSRGQVGGVELSGGQWQRIAVARLTYGVLAGRDVVILDEPTANLDAEAELEIFDRLLEAAKGRTVVLISHRFSTVRRADRIAVLADGGIVELGTHQELLALGGHYATMFHTQADRYLLDTTEATAG
jgi:ATP-binding cassette subfamily B protein